MGNTVSRIAIIYASDEGQTARIARRIEDTVTDRGHDCGVISVDDVDRTFDFTAYDAFLIGASIHAGRHQRQVIEFVTDHREHLAVSPTGFFQVSLSSATRDGEVQAATYVEEIIQETGFSPDRIGLLGGALRFSKYGFLKRLMMRQIAKRSMTDLPPPDDHGDIEFTDWYEVEQFANDFVTFVETRFGESTLVGNDRE